MSTAMPLHRAIVVVDIWGSTTRTNTVKTHLRQVMFELVEKALLEGGIAEQHCDSLIDRGDGVLVLIHPVDQVPKTVLLTTFVPALTEMLVEHNEHRPDHAFRLRAAVHAGEVHYDRRGPFGEAIDITCRLLDAPELKARYRQSQTPLVLVVSDDIYRSVIRHGYDGIDYQAFVPLVNLHIGGYPQRGWVHLPSVPKVTGDVRIDTLLHCTGQERDSRATVRSLDPAAVVDKIIRNEGPS